MKRLVVVFLCIIGLSVYAADYTPFGQTVAPSASMQSVNNAGYMTTGSNYSSSISEVGSYSPSSAPAAGPRKVSGLGTDTSGHDPNNPQFAPLGDAFIPLLLMAFIYTLVVLYKRKKSFS